MWSLKEAAEEAELAQALRGYPAQFRTPAEMSKIWTRLAHFSSHSNGPES